MAFPSRMGLDDGVDDTLVSTKTKGYEHFEPVAHRVTFPALRR